MSEVVHIQQMIALAILSFAFFALAPQGKTSVAKSSLVNNSQATRAAHKRYNDASVSKYTHK